jgi:pyruvate,water dikinase
VTGSPVRHDRVVPLREAVDRSRYGAKASTLARLAGAGVLVPDGLVVPADMSDQDLPATADTLAIWARTRAPFGLVARSSAPAEDGRRSSFAGLYTSVFTPLHTSAILEALRAVRASAANPRALAYARARHTTADLAMAVLAQPAIRPHASGVLAARIPGRQLTQWRIEAVLGLAIPLVAGHQTGDLYRGDGWDERHIEISDKRLLTLPSDETEVDIPPGEWLDLPTHTGDRVRSKIIDSSESLLTLQPPSEWRHAPTLTPSSCNDLLAKAVAGAGVLGFDDIDIEWALDQAGTIHILQARPLTVDLLDLPARPASATGTFRGIPVAGGTGTGPAQHLSQNHSVNKPTQGAVLIFGPIGPAAVPALLASPAGVVSTNGGTLSHTAIIARELGIPCVTAVRTAKEAIPPGARTTVDGTAGTVTIEPVDPPRQKASKDELIDAAVLMATIPKHPHHPGDLRIATLILHESDQQLPLEILDALAPSEGGQTPIGLFNPIEETSFPVRPDGFNEIAVQGLGRLLWPSRAGRMPRRIVVLDSSGLVLHQRPVQPVSS